MAFLKKATDIYKKEKKKKTKKSLERGGIQTGLTV